MPDQTDPITEPSDLHYALLGRYTAAVLGSHERWPGSEVLEWLAEQADNIVGFPSLDSTDEDVLKFWRGVADTLGIEHDGDEFDDETCAEDGCEVALDDGEGYDGYCGTHADEREAAGVYDS